MTDQTPVQPAPEPVILPDVIPDRGSQDYQFWSDPNFESELAKGTPAQGLIGGVEPRSLKPGEVKAGDGFRFWGF